MHLSGSFSFLPGLWRSFAKAVTVAPLRAVVAAAALPLLAVACGGSDGGSTSPAASPGASPALVTKHVTFMAGFKPQANLPFVGVYVAQEKGFFKDVSLDVDIKHAQQGEHLQLLLAGEVQFSTANGAQVLSRNDQGLPLVSIALIGQKSEQGFVVGANSGINTIADWAGKTLGYKGSVPAEFLAIARANNLDPAKVKQVSVGFDPRVLSEGRVDILPVFVSNEPDILNGIGFKTKMFDPNDYGVGALGLTYVTSRDFLNKDPDAVERFVKASLRGIDYAKTHPDEALDIVMKYAPQEDRAHQKYMMTTELDRAQTDLTRKNGIGWQTTEQWQAMADMLLQFQVLKKPATLASVFTDEYVKKTYKDGKLQ